MSRGIDSHFVVPGPEYADCAAVLEELLGCANSVDAAVAFVTHSGVDELEEVLSASTASITLAVRGAPITQPSALVRLAELGVAVSVVVGPRATGFHLKLWLGHTDDRLHVVSGSGNLTRGGLRANAEQFEYLTFDLADGACEQHRERLEQLVVSAVPLDSVKDTGYWREWEKAAAKREEQARQDEEVDELLAKQGLAADAQVALYADLDDLYHRTKAEVRIVTKDGIERPYVAIRFKQAIDRARPAGTLVTVVAGIVKDITGGFQYLAAAGREDLMVETLVLDPTKPYHHLFPAVTKAKAKDTIEQFRAAQEPAGAADTFEGGEHAPEDKG